MMLDFSYELKVFKKQEIKDAEKKGHTTSNMKVKDWYNLLLKNTLPTRIPKKKCSSQQDLKLYTHQ